MSIQLALVPIALALRVVMGKENFNNWVNSLQIKIPTNFENELDLARTVKKAGYDAEKWGGSIKTHIRGEQEFFFWELIDGKWMAVFAKSDSKEMISKFMKDLETKSNRRIFSVNQETKKIEIVPTRTFPTNFRDGELLVKTLFDYGMNPVRQPSGEIICKFRQSTLRFCPVVDAPFSVEIVSAPDLKPIFHSLSTLDEDYKRQIQRATLRNLKEKIQEKELVIEREEVLEDKSIVLTLSIN
ncbi:MAG: hypothetical protein AB4426_09075 [Xenococcaceae cyanobacterium]